MKNFMIFASLVILLLSLVFFFRSQDKQEEGSEQTSTETQSQELLPGKVTIKTQRGPIVFQFYAHHAPATRIRLISLIQNGFYNGLTFHRVIPGFVIQGGDPRGDGRGGSGQKLKAEFSQSLKHKPGTVAMARSQDIDSADSQFYISLGTHPDLDGKYTIFGRVTEGMEVVNKIERGDQMLSVTYDGPTSSPD